MANINKKQRSFLDEILDKRVPAEIAMERLGVSGEQLCKWFAKPVFTGELTKRIDFITKRADMIISQHRLTAAEKLVMLTSCEKEETARKACLDILELTAAGKNEEKGIDEPSLSPETAAKLLEILANANET